MPGCASAAAAPSQTHAFDANEVKIAPAQRPPAHCIDPSRPGCVWTRYAAICPDEPLMTERPSAARSIPRDYAKLLRNSWCFLICDRPNSFVSPLSFETLRKDKPRPKNTPPPPLFIPLSVTNCECAKTVMPWGATSHVLGETNAPSKWNQKVTQNFSAARPRFPRTCPLALRAGALPCPSVFACTFISTLSRESRSVPATEYRL